MRVLIPLFVAAAFLFGCAPADHPAPVAVPVTPTAFGQLHWILGKWRGGEPGGAPFFETYTLLNDSTISQATWADGTFTVRTDSSLVSLRGGHVVNGKAVATAWDATSVRFEPEDPAANAYLWRKEHADQWSAELYMRNGPAKDHPRVYMMRRIAE